MSVRYVTILACEDWAILVWDADGQRVLEYTSELWEENYMYTHGTGDLVVIARLFDSQTPMTYSEGDTARYLAGLDLRFPGIAAAVRGTS